MQATAAVDQVLQLVTFTLDSEEYAVDILSVQEINRIAEIGKVPNAPVFLEGVINLRGKVIPVINLRKKFGLQDREIDGSSRIIIMDIQGVTNGLLVDSVSEVLRIPVDVVEPAPALSESMASKFIQGIANLKNRLLILIDSDKLIGETVQI